jgi:predicted nucleic acid-binding protein
MSVKPAVQFVDTNILIYAYDRSAGSRHELARKLVAGLWQSKRGCLSVQVLQEFYVVASRKLIQVVPAEVRMVLGDLALWRTHAPGAADVLAAVDLHQRYQMSFGDAMVLQSAARLGCSVVWSEDLNPGQTYQSVRVMNPFVSNKDL